MKQNRLQALCILSASAVFSGNVLAFSLADISNTIFGRTIVGNKNFYHAIYDIHTWQNNAQTYGVPMSPTLFNPLLATEVSPGLTVAGALRNVGAPIDLTSLPTVDLITSLPAAILNLRIIDNLDGTANSNTLKDAAQGTWRYAWDTNKKIKELTDPVTGLSTKVTGIDNRLFNVANWAYDTNKLLLPKLATEVTSVKADVTGMVTDVTDVKNDVSGMVSDLGLVKAAVDTLSTVGTEFGEVVTVVGQVDDKVVSLGSSVASVGSDVATVIDDLGAIDTALDAGVFSINDQISVALGAIERVEKVVADPNLTTAFDILATDGASIVSNLEAVVEDAAKMQTLVNNVNNIMDQMPTGIDVEISDMLMAAQNLLEFSRARAADAESLAVTFVDQTRLITATYKLADALKGDVLDDIKFNVLLDLLNVMPYQLVNLTGYGLQLVGVNTLFIEKIEQATLDVVLLREVKTSNRLATGSAAFLPAGSAESCNFVESKRGDIKESSQRVSDLGKASTIIGKALIAIGNTAVKVPTEPVLGVHGYASFKIKNNMLKKFGSIFDGIGQVLSSMADSTDGKLNHCEVIHYQQAILETTCYLTRGRGPMCQRWVGSEEQSNMLN
jgi:hypothetical protein